MKLLKTLFLVSIIALVTVSILFPPGRWFGATTPATLKPNALKEGDIIFQTSASAQSKAIQIATHSPYSHCGILFKKNSQWYVFEAVQPVKYTPLTTWIARGVKQQYIIKRLKDTTILRPEGLKKMKQYGLGMLGKNYDSWFGWGNDRIYCSELVWKIYKNGGGIELCPTGKLKDFDLSDKLVAGKLKERFGASLPLNETVVSPVDIYNSALLVTVEGL